MKTNKLTPELILKSLTIYEGELSNVEEEIQVKGKTFEAAAREQASLLYYYESRLGEIKVMLEFQEVEIERVRSKKYKAYDKTSNRVMQDREKEKWIDSEDTYIEARKVMLAIRDVYNQYTAVVNAFTSRGYQLNNIARIRSANRSDELI